MILESFPAGFVPRSIQKELLTEIETHLKSGYKTIVLSAPTGVGKSPIAATLARHFGRSFIVTASKQLQDQYVSDFGFLKPVKGKSNFVCLPGLAVCLLSMLTSRIRMLLTSDLSESMMKPAGIRF